MSDKLTEWLTKPFLEEDINIPVNIGDTILVGKFKNKKMVIKDIGKDDHGMPTINGRKAATFRMGKKVNVFDEDNIDESKKEFVIWGIPPKKSSEEILYTKAKSQPEAKKVIKILTKKHGVKKARIQVLDLEQDPSKFWKSDDLFEGVNDPGIFKAVFLAGGPGSGKTYVSKQLFGIPDKFNISMTGMKMVNSDKELKYLLNKFGFGTDLDKMPDEVFKDLTEPGKSGLRKFGKELTAQRLKLYKRGKLGMIIDGTGHDYSKLDKIKKDLEKDGYDTYMVFVNTSLEVAQKRNLKRDRILPAKILEDSWKAVQKNFGKYQRLFGKSNFIKVDNNTTLTDEEAEKKFVPLVNTHIKKFVNKPIKSKLAKKWIHKQKFIESIGLSAGGGVISGAPSVKKVNKVKKQLDKKRKDDKYSKIDEKTSKIKKVVGIYAGRFQPFGPHHKKVYEWMKKQFDDVYITTSDIKKPPKHPMNFKEKKKHITKMGIPPNKIVKEKQPYVATTVLKKFDKDTTAVVYVFGAKDADRLATGTKKGGGATYYQDYKKNKNKMEPTWKHGYILTAPHVSIKSAGMEVSGTAMRQLLGSPKYADDRESRFKKFFGYYDSGIFNMMVSKFEKLFNEDIILTKELIEDFIIDNDIPGILSESTGTTLAPIDDGPSTYYKGFDDYKKFSKIWIDDIFAETGWEVLKYMISDNANNPSYDYTLNYRFMPTPSYGTVGTSGRRSEMSLHRKYKDRINFVISNLGFTVLKWLGLDEVEFGTTSPVLPGVGKNNVGNTDRAVKGSKKTSGGIVKMHMESKLFSKEWWGGELLLEDDEEYWTDMSVKSQRQYINKHDTDKEEQPDNPSDKKERGWAPIETEKGSYVTGVSHGQNMDDELESIKKKFKPTEKVTFIGEGGWIDKEEEIEDEETGKKIKNPNYGKVVGLEGEQAVMLDGLKKYFGGNLEVQTMEDGAGVYDSREEVYDYVAKKVEISKPETEAAIWSSMMGQKGSIEPDEKTGRDRIWNQKQTDDALKDMPPVDFLSQDGVEWLNNNASAAGLEFDDPTLEKPTVRDMEILYQLNFPEDDGTAETEVSHASRAYNEFRDINTANKINKAENDKRKAIVTPGGDHVKPIGNLLNKEKKEVNENLKLILEIDERMTLEEGVKFNNFLKDWAKRGKQPLDKVRKSMMNKNTFSIAKLNDFSVDKVFEMAKKGFKGYQKIINYVPNKIAHKLSQTKFGQKKEKSLRQLDNYLKDHPKLKRVMGIAAAAAVTYAWTKMTFIGDPEYDLDLSAAASAAALGDVSFADLFSGEMGTKFLVLTVVGASTGLTAPYVKAFGRVGTMAAGLSFGAYRAYKARKQKKADAEKKDAGTSLANAPDKVKNPNPKGRKKTINRQSAIKWVAKNKGDKAAKKYVKSLSERMSLEDEVNLLIEGGAAGHMNHPFDDKDLTFGDLKNIITLGLSGNLDREDGVTEKLDGQNLMVSWIDGKLVTARNKGQLKNFGAKAMTTKGTASKFAGRGDIKDAFVFAMKDMGKAIGSLSDKQKEKIFMNGKAFMNLEVMWPKSANVINYDKAEIVFHGALEYDKNGNAVGEVKGSARILAGMIKQVNQHIQKHFKIGKPNFLTVPKSQNFDSKKKTFLSRLSTLQKEFALKDTDPLSMYHEMFWQEYIMNGANQTDFMNITDDIVEKLGKRWAFFDKSYKISDIKKDLKEDHPEFLDWVLTTDKVDHQKMVKQNMRPFEVLFFAVGTEILKNISGYIAASPDNVVQKIRKDVIGAIKKVKSSKDIKKIKLVRDKLDQLNAIGGMDSIVPTEGIVFKYKGKMYKFTGAFNSVNSIIGALKF
jgi:predicted kinase